MTMAWEWGYVQDVRYSGFAGRLYGCSRLITSGTSNPAKTGYVKWREWRHDDRPNAVSGPFAESKFLSLSLLRRGLECLLY